MPIKFKHALLNLLVMAARDCIKILGPVADRWDEGPQALCTFHKIVYLGARAHESDEALNQLITFCKTIKFGTVGCGNANLPYFDGVLFTFLHSCDEGDLELICDFAESLSVKERD